MKTRNKLKIMGLLLTLVMTVSLLGMFSLTATAAEGDVASVTVGETTTNYTSLDDALIAAQNNPGSTLREPQEIVQVDGADGDYEASVTTGAETVNYEELTEAIEAAKANSGATLKLLKDIGTNVLIDGGTFIFDLNGHTIAADTKFDSVAPYTNQFAMNILKDADITLIGSGSIISNGPNDPQYTTWLYCIRNQGTLTINGPMQIRTNGYTYNSGIYSYGGTLTIHNCNIEVRRYAVEGNSGAQVTINGGSFAGDIGVYGGGNAAVNINGGTITGSSYDVFISNAGGLASVKLGIGSGGAGPSFPGGLSINNLVGLSDLLNPNYYYMINGNPVDMTAITTEMVGGDVSVGYCDHSSNINGVPVADDATHHSLFCSNCQARIKQEQHSITGSVCTGCGYGCSHPDVVMVNGVVKCAACPVVMVAQVGDSYYARLSDAVAQANAVNGSTLTLLSDVKGDIVVDPGRSFTLDLNGKTLRGTGKSVITIGMAGGSGASLIMKSSVSGGKVTGCYHQNAQGTVVVNTWSTFTMESGVISENMVDSGGGVYVVGGTFNMKGGEISGNTADWLGGGVILVGTSASFTMDGGSIRSNTVTIDDKNREMEGIFGGGGVYVDSGTFTMNAGTISGNSSTYTRGGGVQVAQGTFVMNGGTIEGNSAAEKGGGVYVMKGENGNPSGTFTVGGSSVITGNTVNGSANNVYLAVPLTIGSNLSTTAGIGITGSTTPTDTGVEIASSGATEINKSAFISDNINYSIVQKEGKLYLYPHIHNWTYTADCSTITATCKAEDCYDAEQSITISAEGKTYDGTPVTATLDGSIDGVAAPEITYSGNTNAGTYTASITIEGKTASVSFEITKATISNVTATVTAPEAGAVPQTTVTAGTDYSAEIKWNETVEKFGFNTAYTATVTLTADSNHQFADNLSVDGWNVALDTSKTVATLTKTFDVTRKVKLTELTDVPVNKTLTGYYADVSGAISELLATVTYTTESGNVTVVIEWICDNYNSATKAANTFAWSVKAGELDNYDVNNIETSGSITVTNVDALPVTNTSSDNEITYDGSKYDVSEMFTKDTNAGEASYVITGGTGAGTLTGSDLTITKAGTIEITMTTAANGVYAAGSVTATLTVNKAAGAGSVTMDGWTYGDTAKAPTTEDGTGTATFLYTGNGYSSAEVPTDAGEYTVTATFAENDLYEQATATDTFTIAQMDLTATISGSVTKTYDGTKAVPSEHGLSITLNTPVSSDNVTASATYTYDGVNVGTTKINATGITLSGAAAGNYKLTKTTASADVGTITKAAAPAIVWPEASSLVYGQKLSASTLTSNDSNGTFAWQDGSIVPTVANNGYVVVYTPKDMNNYDYSGVELTQTITVEVSKKTVTITAENKSICVDKEQPALTYTVEGLLDDDTLSTIPTLTTNAVMTTAGDYAIIASGADAGDNYTVTYQNGTLTVKNHTPGASATHTRAQTCTECGHIITPARGHRYSSEWTSNDTHHWQSCSCGAKRRMTTHTPGEEATHTTAQTCTVCGHELQAALGHSYGTEWEFDGTNHWHECSCGDKTDVAEHTPHADDGDCTTDITCSVCDDVTTEGASSHTGGTATCEHKAECTVCGKEYGNLANHSPNADDNDCTTDITCSVCGEVTTEGADTHTGGTATCEHKAECTVCGTEYGNFAAHIPNADDGDCTTDITCSVCGDVTTEGADSHTGGTATCEHKAECTVCGKEYGNFAAHIPNADDGDCTTDITCSVCGEVTTEGADTHTGGTATCEHKAECTVCGKEYGNGLSGGAIAGIVTGSVVVLGGGGFAIYWFVIKKKTWADLIAVFKKKKENKE